MTAARSGLTVPLMRLVVAWWLRRLGWRVGLPLLVIATALCVAVWSGLSARQAQDQLSAIVERERASQGTLALAVPDPVARFESELKARLSLLPTERDSHRLIADIESALRRSGDTVVALSIRRSTTATTLAVLQIDVRIEGHGPRILAAIDQALAVEPSVVLTMLDLDKGDSPARSWTATARFDVLMQREPS